jgi:hypothetical protein
MMVRANSVIARFMGYLLVVDRDAGSGVGAIPLG